MTLPMITNDGLAVTGRPVALVLPKKQRPEVKTRHYDIIRLVFSSIVGMIVSTVTM
jgi:hypothetical protein